MLLALRKYTGEFSFHANFYKICIIKKTQIIELKLKTLKQTLKGILHFFWKLAHFTTRSVKELNS